MDLLRKLYRDVNFFGFGSAVAAAAACCEQNTSPLLRLHPSTAHIYTNICPFLFLFFLHSADDSSKKLGVNLSIPLIAYIRTQPLYAKNQVQGGLLLNIVVRECPPIL